jgi:hypothetical protein
LLQAQSGADSDAPAEMGGNAALVA